jgi:hypothetical protein
MWMTWVGTCGRPWGTAEAAAAAAAFPVDAAITVDDGAFFDDGKRESGRSLHSSTLQLNLSACCVTGGAVVDFFGGV